MLVVREDPFGSPERKPGRPGHPAVREPVVVDRPEDQPVARVDRLRLGEMARPHALCSRHELARDVDLTDPGADRLDDVPDAWIRARGHERVHARRDEHPPVRRDEQEMFGGMS